MPNTEHLFQFDYMKDSQERFYSSREVSTEPMNIMNYHVEDLTCSIEPLPLASCQNENRTYKQAKFQTHRECSQVEEVSQVNKLPLNSDRLADSPTKNQQISIKSYSKLTPINDFRLQKSMIYQTIMEREASESVATGNQGKLSKSYLNLKRNYVFEDKEALRKTE